MKRLYFLLVILLSVNLAQAQWTDCNGISGIKPIDTYKIVVKDKYIYAGSLRPGIYISSDYGNTWELKKINEQNYQISNIVVSGDAIFIGVNGIGVFKSTDNGNTWVAKNNGLDDLSIYNMAISGNNLVCRLYKGQIFVSTDSGENWTNKTSGLPDSYLYATDINISGNNIIASTLKDGFYYSSNLGDTWEPRNNGIKPQTNTKAGFIKTIDNRVYATVYGHMYFSDNLGANWSEINSNIIFEPSELADEIYVSSDTIFISTRIIQINNNDKRKIYFSSDNGQTWERRENGLPDTQVKIIAFSNGNYFIGLANIDGAGGLFRSTNSGLNWESTYKGMTSPSVHSILCYDNKIYLGTYYGIYESTDNGDSWEEKNNGITKFNIRTIHSFNDILFACSDNYVYVSTNGGNDWESKNNGVEENFATSGIISFNNNLFLHKSASGVYRSSDMGEKWIQINNGLQSKNTTEITSYDNTLYLSTFDAIYSSTDMGENWIEINNEFQGKYIMSFCILPNGNILAGASKYGVFISTDMGSSWRNTLNGLPTTCQVLKIFSYKNLVFIGTSSGVYYSADEGESWIERNEGLSDLNIQSFGISADYIFVGTTKNGIFRDKLSNFPVGIKSDYVEKGCTISPNPASEYIIVGAKGPSPLREDGVSEEIRIFDIFGNEMHPPRQTSSDTPQEGNKYRIDVSTLPTGVYFVRIGNKIEKFVKL